MRFQRKEIPQFNSSSMADVAFLLLIFFLLVSSLESNTGIYRQLSEASPDTILKESMDIRSRNFLNIRIDESNRLLLEEEEIPLTSLKAIAKNFISNPDDLDYLPEKEILEFDFIGSYPATSKHVIQLGVDRKSKYQSYISVLSELTSAYNELREELAKSYWGKAFTELGEEERNVIRQVYPQKISEKETEEGGKL